MMSLMICIVGAMIVTMIYFWSNLVKKMQKKYLDAKFIKSPVVSLGTALICSYCAKQLTISTAFSHFRNQCKEIMVKSGCMKDYREAIRTKNNRANESYKRNHGKFMAKVCDLKK